MPRVKGGPTHARKRKRIMKKASGMRGGFGTLYRSAREFTRKADVYAYEHRRQKKRLYRSLWITRLSAALKQRGLSYNRFIHALSLANVALNRKMLAELAVADAAAFDAVVAVAKPHLPA